MTRVPKVAIVAHAGKTFGGGLVELRRVLEEEGIADPLWAEVPKSRKAPKQVKRALKDGAELLFVWGGDGTVQQCLDTVAGRSEVPVAIVPAGTANLFATNLGIPQDIRRAVAIGLRGERRSLDVGRFNGERFGVMAGAGFDAAMIHDADGGLKDRLGRVAYVWTASKNLRAKPFKAKISVDGVSWYNDKASCILVGERRTAVRRAIPMSRADVPIAIARRTAVRRCRRGCSSLCRCTSSPRPPRSSP